MEARLRYTGINYGQRYSWPFAHLGRKQLSICLVSRFQLFRIPITSCRKVFASQFCNLSKSNGMMSFIYSKSIIAESWSSSTPKVERTFIIRFATAAVSSIVTSLVIVIFLCVCVSIENQMIRWSVNIADVFTQQLRHLCNTLESVKNIDTAKLEGVKKSDTW